MASNLAKLLSSTNSTTFSSPNCTLATPKPAGGGALKRNLTKALPLALIFAATFTLTFLSQRHEAPTNPTNALGTNNYTLSLSVDKLNLEFSVDATPDGSLKIASHNITLDTNAPQGASIVAKFDDMSLKHANSGEIDPIFASTTSPATLDMNTWGIAVANDVSNATNSMSPNSKYQNSQPDALFATPYELLIYKGTTKTFPVYYGVNINSTIPEGNYSQTVTYTAYTLSSANTSPDNLEITPNLIASTATTPITIKTSIKTSKAIDSSAIKVYIKDSPCTSINIVQNYPNNIHLTCNAPARSSVGGIGKKAITINIPNDKTFLTVNNAIEYADPAPMQSFTETDCNNMTQHQMKYLKDTRDNEIYTVAKLKDNKCWMTQNLRLKLSTSKALTPADSNVSSNWTPTRSTDTASCARGVAWNQDSEGYKTVRSCYQSESTYNTNGVYYTHSAAAAQSANNIDNDGGEAPSSICPKGWRLPKTTTNPTNSEFYTMAQHYKGDLIWNGNEWSKSNGFHNMLSSPQNFIYSGRRWHDSDGVALVGSNGFWWSSTAYSSVSAYAMSMNSSNISPREYYGRNFGFSVRCIVKEAYLQDFTEQDCNNMTQHQTKTLTDSRDGEKYTIAKLADNKCWMTQNLRLKLSTSTTLTPANTDISSNWIPNRSTESSNGTGGSYNQGSGANWGDDPEGYKTVRSIYRTPTYNTHGVYYTHSAATAQSANNIDTSGQNAPHSICPKGWRLPTSSNTNGQGEFWQLADKYKGSASWNSSNISLSGSHTLMQAPVSFPLSGLYDYDGYFYTVGSYGVWWSSTVLNSDDAYNLYQNSSGLGPHGDWDRCNGLSVRCVAR